MSILANFVTFDQVSPGQLAGCEAIARHVLQIHATTKRNTRNPDFNGTRLMIMSTLDSSGGVLAGDFAKWTTEEQKNYAFTLKQQRLYAEEEDRQDKRAAQSPDGPNKKK